MRTTRRPRIGPALLGLALACGCAGGRREITPTTLGTDWTRAPRGKMIPFPWPGQDLSKATPRPAEATTDPRAALASGEDRAGR